MEITMMHRSLPTAESPLIEEASSIYLSGLEIIYFVGECPIRLRSRDITPPRSHARAVLVVLAVSEVAWAGRIADVIDAWETAYQSSDPFWIKAVAERIKRLALISNGLMIFTPPAA
ncbi:hypothetical protein JL101_025410 [Skermanella rosea]|uniref:hypothetical protein n=1 Tax=Skermanella rosea TaxID=1817965 RepID=UPI0019346A5F|nr:hypothetical protein [Skermanella rosea]UEM03269.1 hypothetical protein JL101_025410 [Skermanella rosea]